MLVIDSVELLITSYATHSALLDGFTTAYLTNAMVNARASSLAMAILSYSIVSVIVWRVLTLPGRNDEVLPVATHYTIRLTPVLPSYRESHLLCFPVSQDDNSHDALRLTLADMLVSYIPTDTGENLSEPLSSPHWCRDQDLMYPHVELKDASALTLVRNKHVTSVMYVLDKDVSLYKTCNAFRSETNVCCIVNNACMRQYENGRRLGQPLCVPSFSSWLVSRGGWQYLSGHRRTSEVMFWCIRLQVHCVVHPA